MNDRIKLAEAMGWRLDPDLDFIQGSHTNYWLSPDANVTRVSEALPDPFTDANDDYAVLEWMRSHGTDYQPPSNKFSGELFNPQWHYQIGDYARAALKVLT